MMRPAPLPPLPLPPRINYAAFFLTLACDLACPWCINLDGGRGRGEAARGRRMDGDAWLAAADRLRLRPDLPLTLQGGEPTRHPEFFRIVAEARADLKMDLLTNFSFDEEEFIRRVPVARFTREAPYAAIRASWHPGQNDLAELRRKARRLMAAGFRVGLYALEPPDPAEAARVRAVRDAACAEGLDFRLKEFLGRHEGRLHGTYRYPGAVGGPPRPCRCRTSELLVGPDGAVHRCHSDLYDGVGAVGHILDPDFSAERLERFLPCDRFGACNPCDVKVKTDRFQVYGHTSVEVVEPEG